MQGINVRFKKLVAVGAVLGAFGFAALGLSTSGSAATLPRDCDATSIIYCGSTTLEELKSDYSSNDSGRYSDIPAVFNHFGISSADISGMNSTNHKRGIVRADNTVWLDGKLIGVNAKTAGRVNKPGSTAIPGTGAFMRSPSVSFASSSTQIDAFVGYENGSPAWAVLSSCGNPVTWDKPSIEVEKKIRSANNQSWVEDDLFKNGSTLTYQITVRNTGKVADTNVLVKDTLPNTHKFVGGSVAVNGQNVGTAGNSLVGSGYTLAKVDAGATVTITFQATVMVSEEECGDTAFTNRVRVDGDLTPPKEDTAGGNVRVVCVTVKCVSLTASALSVKKGETINFTATALVENATVQSYEFRVNNNVVQNTSSNTFAYATTQEGDFVVKVTVKTDKGDNTNLNCEQRVTVNEVPVCPYNPSLPPESPNCKKPEVCPYNPNLPLESPDCKKPQVKGVKTLPKTGVAGVAGMFLGTSMTGAAVHYLVNRRRG
ncbi:MAG: PKD domain-containing protein [bacterium]|nr:PKD domain-containing protein [bacterium]